MNEIAHRERFRLDELVHDTVQRIAWLHHGRLRILSPEHAGARLCLALPMASRH